MKILFVCHRLPYPPNRGGKIRPFNMIRHLSKKHEIVVGSLVHTSHELNEGAGLNDYCNEVIAEVVPDAIRWAQATTVLFRPEPSSVAYFWSPRLRDKIEAASSRRAFDAIIVHCAFAAQYALGIPAKFRLMDFGDLDSGKWSDYGKWRSFPLSVGYRYEAQKLRAYERQVAQHFDYCTLTTEGELEEFRKLQVARPHSVIPNGVDTVYFSPNDGNNKHVPVIVFVGRMDYFPNIDGVLYFAKAILPIIRRGVSNLEFRIVGSNPTQQIRKLANVPGITVTGHVKDVRPHLQNASVSIAPLRIARGTQNKILESMAMGTPVVATPQAAKGVQAYPGQHLLVAEEPQAFADMVMNLLEQSESRKKLSSAGRRQVEEVHAWASSMNVLDRILAHEADA